VPRICRPVERGGLGLNLLLPVWRPARHQAGNRASDCVTLPAFHSPCRAGVWTSATMGARVPRPRFGARVPGPCGVVVSAHASVHNSAAMACGLVTPICL
jgi:hypothetical protein